MTCCPYWKEITESLEPGQTSKDRTELCNRVFLLKSRELQHRLIKDQIFGRVVAHVCVNKFHKRGLVQSHIILLLDEPSKSAPRNPENIDKLISAEIPRESEASLREQILRHMTHHPCIGNPTAVCKKPGGNGSCSKSFPKRFRQTGSTDTDHYFEYQRRGPEYGGEAGLIRLNGDGFQVDNRWVFPYSRKLLRMFQCHMNVEVCVSRVGSIEYLFKYVCKGSDRVSVQFSGEARVVNEIDQFIDARYISASEAAWRIMGLR